jgi:hypothetical protein
MNGRDDAPLLFLTALADVHLVAADIVGRLHWLEVVVRSGSNEMEAGTADPRAALAPSLLWLRIAGAGTCGLLSFNPSKKVIYSIHR